MSVSKVILINKSASVKKYGKTSWKKIETALNKLVGADKKRNVISVVFAVDSKSQMKKVGGKPVTKSSSARQVKYAIDAIFRSMQPHYLMILGAPDLIPHVKLRNPIARHQAGEERDRDANLSLHRGFHSHHDLPVQRTGLPTGA